MQPPVTVTAAPASGGNRARRSDQRDPAPGTIDRFAPHAGGATTTAVRTSLAPTAPEVRPPAARMPYIDGLRGLSAAYVVLFHIEEFATSRFAGALPWWWGASRILSFGDCAVGVFIVVSGYCLMLPVVADGRLQLRGG